MRTVVFGTEKIYASHKMKGTTRVAIVVDKDGKEVNVVFPEGKYKDHLFDYNDWLNLEYYQDKKEQ